MMVDPFTDDSGLPTELLLLMAPGLGQSGVGCRVAQLWAQGCEVASNAGGRNCCCRFNRDVFASLSKGAGQVPDSSCDHRFAAGHNAMLRGERFHFLQYF